MVGGRSTIDSSAYLLSSRTEYPASDACCRVENLVQCDKGQNGCNERNNLCRTEFQPLHVTWRVTGHTRVTVKNIAPPVAEGKERGTKKQIGSDGSQLRIAGLTKMLVFSAHLNAQPTPTDITTDVVVATPALLAFPSPRRFPILAFHHNPRRWEEPGKMWKARARDMKMIS